MAELKKVDVLSYARMRGFFGVVGGAVLGIVYGFMGAAYASFNLFFSVIAFIAVFFATALLVAGVSFVVGIIEAAIYNYIAKKWGGVKVEISK